jgi:DnaK suppressor protein
MITTTATPTQRKKKPEPSVPIEPHATKPKPVKTHLDRKQLKHYEQQLLIKRAELVGDLNSLETEALRSNGGEISHMPIHMADIGSDTYEQDFMLGLAETERERLREIDEALARIKAKTYGVCLMTHKAIPKARLEAKPWAKYTIEAARQRERGLA